MSVDSIHSHANFGASLGGVSFPMLADFHPRGAVGQSLGAYFEPGGFDDRATVIVDAAGTVRYAVSVGPGGRRDIDALAAECEAIDAAYEGSVEPIPARQALPTAALYIKSNCGFSRAVSLARANLHLEDALPIFNITEDQAKRHELETVAGKTQAPCLMIDGDPMFESTDIIETLRRRTVGW